MESLTAGTGLVILWYTFETHQVRREIVRQNEIAIQPVVIAMIEGRPARTVPTPEIPSGLILRNIGRGPALFLRVRDLTVKDPIDGVRFLAKFTPISYLEPLHEEVVRISEYRAINAHVSGDYLQLLPSLEQSTALEDYDVVIEYQDTSGDTRETVMRVGKSGVSLVRIGRQKAAVDQHRHQQGRP